MRTQINVRGLYMVTFDILSAVTRVIYLNVKPVEDWSVYKEFYRLI